MITAKNAARIVPPFPGLGCNFAYNIMANEHATLAIMKIVGPSHDEWVDLEAPECNS